MTKLKFYFDAYIFIFIIIKKNYLITINFLYLLEYLKFKKYKKL